MQDSAYVGSSHGSGFVGCDTWKLAGRTPGTSAATDANSLQPTCTGNAGKKPTDGHGGGSNYMMADGSAKWRTWKQVRQNDMYLFKLLKPATSYTP